MRLLQEAVKLIGWPATREVPSIREQTPWPCDFFDFRAASKPGTDYFNPGLVERDGVRWLLARRAVNWPGQRGMNDIVAFELDQNMLPRIGYRCGLARTFNGQHHEDPRGVEHGGLVFLSTTTFIIQGRRFSGAHQSLAVLNKRWQKVRHFDPVYGQNGNSLLANKGWEKNWLWFFHGSQLLLIYLTQPHTVVEFDERMRAGTTWVTQGFHPDWRHGSARGGTPPVRVGNEYWTFFHSSLPWQDRYRRYYMGAYAFAAAPPFEITRMTPLPLLSGSRADPWNPEKPLVVFPCGALLRDGEWTVSMGVNDLCCAWIKIPHEELYERTAKVAVEALGT